MTTETTRAIQRIARNTWRADDPIMAIELFTKRGYDWTSVQHHTELARLVKAGSKVLIRRSGHIVVSGRDPTDALSALDLAERMVIE